MDGYFSGIADHFVIVILRGKQKGKLNLMGKWWKRGLPQM